MLTAMLSRQWRSWPTVQRAADRFWSLQSKTWDDRLADPATAERVDALAAWLIAALRPNPLVVDIGCGTGNHLNALAKVGAIAIGLERAPGMLASASRKVRSRPDRRIAIVAADARHGLPLAPSTLDGAVSVYSAQFLDAAALFTSVRRALRPGGVFLVEVPRQGAARRPVPDHLRRRFKWSQRLNRTAAWFGARAGIVRTFHPAEIDVLLTAVGFVVIGHRDTERAVAALARVPA